MITTDKTPIIVDKKFSREIAKSLLDIDAVLLRPNDPFTWSSGWNSPIYCDNRLTLRYPEVRKKIASAFISIIRDELETPDVITGTATAGIPHAAWVAGSMNLPMAYVRAKAKAYGLGNQIEGGVDKGQTTVIIEDLISTGGSAISVVDALNFIGANIAAVLAIFSYGFDKANQRFSKHNIPVYTLTDYATLIDVALEEGKVKESDIDLLNRWRANPEKWPN
ncbi:orotate phosphoribosyltransferase [Rhodohalobacter sp. SW132]|uniref:orotate phosphoribosyltransferase n=1 Tax=Rhodohalobacter sp. SW132 TaxID=2293433 RepID=UPI000E22BD8B|nr:orotate phosphoribosyltransferase [Rhodohalobacter sp. SW132]REL29078.1 orotate phosphoribosyltransferase [Rhodohalobacter sp. SW132]